MNKTTKRSIIVSAILSIMLCVSLVAGATFALFTSESKANIVVSSGKVNVTASVTDVQTKSLGFEYAAGKDKMWAGAGAVAIDNGTITINNMVVGDGVKFTIKVVNESSVTVKWRTIISCEDAGLFEALDVKIDNTTYNGATNISNYKTLTTTDTIDDVNVEIVFPDSENANDFQNKTCTISYKVEAVQGNADVEDPDENTVYINNINDLLAFSPTRNLGGYGYYKLEFINDIDMTRWTSALDIDYISIDVVGNGHTLRNMKAALFDRTSNNTLTIKNLVVENADINYSTAGNTPGAVFVNYVNSNGASHVIDIENCQVNNSSVYAYKWAGAFIGAEAAANGTYTIKNCDVKNTTITTADSSVGAYVGYVMSEVNIENCNVSGTTAVKCNESRGGSDAKAGIFAGTVGSTAWVYKTTHIKNCTVADTVTLTNRNAQDAIANGYVGRLSNVGAAVEVVNGSKSVVYCAPKVLKNVLTSSAQVTLESDYVVVGNWESIIFTDALRSEYKLDGENHSISGLTAPLLGEDASIKITIENLTIKDSKIGTMSTSNGYHSGAFLSFIDGGISYLKLYNCHTNNVDVTAADGGASSAGSLVGYIHPANAAKVIISGCTVTGGSVTNAYGNAAGIVGYVGTSSAAERIIEDCTVKDCKITGEATNKTGCIVGSVTAGATLKMNNCTATGCTTGNPATALTNLYGRIVDVDTTIKTYISIDGTVKGSAD